MKKTIILISPTFTYGLTECIVKNLEYCNFQVINLSNTIPNTINFNILDKITYKIARLFLGKKTSSKIKDRIRFYKYNKEIKNALSILYNKKADYTLCIRPDLYDHKLLEYIKKISKKFIAYQWDGLNRYPKALEKIKYFDKFYVFDKNDLKKESGLNYITNFYFDYNLEKLHTQKNKQQKINFYFIGFFQKSRVYIIDKFISALEAYIDINKNIDFYILLDELENVSLFKNQQKIVFLPKNNPIHFEENLLNSFNSDVLVDFTVSEHSGLSFRIFEAIGYNKKLITTNATIKEYDFYNPNNIFIIENEHIDISELRKFLLLPMYELPKNIIEKYSFTTWINQITC